MKDRTDKPRTQAQKDAARDLYEERLITVASRFAAACIAAQVEIPDAELIKRAEQLIGECRARVSVIEFL